MSVEATPADLSDRDYASLADTRRLLRRIQALSERAAETAGLRPRQYQLLLMLRGLAVPHRDELRALAPSLVDALRQLLEPALRPHSMKGT